MTICEKCGYMWKERKSNPVECPSCHRYLNPQSSRQPITPLKTHLDGVLYGCPRCNRQTKALFKYPDLGVVCPLCIAEITQKASP